MNLGDMIGDSMRLKLMDESISVGDIFLVRLSEKNGITPHKGESFRFKFIVVLGFDDDSIICGGVVINSKINQNVSELIRRYHFKIYQKDYDFLKHDSFVNCSSLVRIKKESVSESKCVGRLNESDLECSLESVKECPNIPKALLKQFGLI